MGIPLGHNNPIHTLYAGLRGDGIPSKYNPLYIHNPTSDHRYIKGGNNSAFLHSMPQTLKDQYNKGIRGINKGWFNHRDFRFLILHLAEHHPVEFNDIWGNGKPFYRPSIFFTLKFIRLLDDRI